jgi:hypothetical protein
MGGSTDTLDPRDLDGGPSFEQSFGIPGTYLAWILAALLGIFVAAALGRVVLDAAAASARVEALRAENAALEARVDALAAEKQLVTSPIFVEVAGRGRGYGDPAEQAFGLLPGGAPPPDLERAAAASGERGSPLDAWLAALFGSAARAP